MKPNRLIAGLLCFSAILPLAAQSRKSLKDTTMTLERAERLVPRIIHSPVRPLVPDGMAAMDTLDTADPAVKILLYPNYSWKYKRDASASKNSATFTENWTSEYPDPYKTSLGSLPDKVTFWVVDTLSDYRCPNQVAVYSAYGYRHRRHHSGVDLPLKTGDPVYAAFAGKVRMSKYYKGYGNLVVLRHENGLETFYAHLSKRNVEVGDWVEAGQVVGLGGATGRATGAHLHFETRYHGYSFDPEWLIDFKTGDLRHRVFTLRKKYLSMGSKYVPDSDEEEYEINEADAKDKEIAKAREEERLKAEREAAEASAQYYRIRSGDTLGRIAQRYHTTVSRICSLNPGLTSKSTLRIGRNIRVK